MKASGSAAHRLAFERRVAVLAALGQPRKVIAKQMGVDPSTVWRIMNREHVADMIEQFAIKAEATMEEKLTQGAMRATERLVELMESENEKVALGAAVRLAEMDGKRGRPIDRVQTQSVNLTGDAAQMALANALRDPGVRKWLTANPEAQAGLRALMPGNPTVAGSDERHTEGDGAGQAVGPI